MHDSNGDTFISAVQHVSPHDLVEQLRAPLSAVELLLLLLLSLSLYWQHRNTGSIAILAVHSDQSSIICEI
jgi:hypothetical protein